MPAGRVDMSVSGRNFANENSGFSVGHSGPMVDLNTLVSPGSAQHLAEPETINDRGEINGFRLLPTGHVHAFLLIPSQESTDVCGDEAAPTAATKQTKSTLTVAQNLAIRPDEGGTSPRHWPEYPAYECQRISCCDVVESAEALIR